MIGFIIIRHVNSEITNIYWKLCVKCIRKFYPKNKIMIIDDNSNRAFVNNRNVNMRNCDVVHSEFPGRGEILPYYYFYKKQPFSKAVVLHDSVFIQKKIDIHFIKNVDINFLWNFSAEISNNVEQEVAMLSRLGFGNELVDFYHNRLNWYGIFGIMSVISLNFCNKIFTQYNLESLLHMVGNRNDRMSAERVFAVVCHFEDRSLIHRGPIFGNILGSSPLRFGYSINDYKNDKIINNRAILNLPAIKVWTGR